MSCVGSAGSVVGQVVPPGSVGNISGTVVSAPTYTSTGGSWSAGSIVMPPTNNGSLYMGTVELTQATPTYNGVGGGGEATTSTTTYPGVPNTGLGDETYAYIALFLAMLALVELPLLLRKSKR